MSRCAIVGTNAPVFMMKYWLKNFERWEDEVDKVYMVVDLKDSKDSGLYGLEPSIWEYVEKMLTSHPKIELIRGKEGWPNTYKEGVLASKEEKILILHDDVFIKDGGIIKDGFDMLEEGRIVTPMNSMYSPVELVEEAMDNRFYWFQIKTNDFQKTGYSFLTYFLFLHRKDLMKTSLDFGGWSLHKDEYSPLLDTVAKVEWAGDTGFKLELEMLNNGVNIRALPRFPFSDLDIARQYVKKEGVFSEDCRWIHIMAMGTSIGAWVPKLKSRDVRPVDQVGKHNEDHTAMKLAWLQKFIDCDDFTGLQEYKKFYEEELSYIINRLKVNKRKIKIYRYFFDLLMEEGS